MIFISTAHHSEAKGASFGDFNEYDESMRWAHRLADLLEDYAIEVPYGRLPGKIKFINDICKKTDGYHIAVEVHFNSAVNSHSVHVGRGCETLYCPKEYTKKPDGRILAERIQSVLSIPFEPSRGADEGWYQKRVGGKPDYFLSRTACTAIIIEPEFVHHKDKIQEARSVGCLLIAEQLKQFMEDRS